MQQMILTPCGNWGGPSWGKILLHAQLRFCPPGPTIEICLCFFTILDPMGPMGLMAWPLLLRQAFLVC